MGHLAVVLGASLSLLSIPPVVETQTGGGLSAAFFLRLQSMAATSTLPLPPHILPHWWQPMGQKLKLMAHVAFHSSSGTNTCKGLSSPLM